MTLNTALRLIYQRFALASNGARPQLLRNGLTPCKDAKAMLM